MDSMLSRRLTIMALTKKKLTVKAKTREGVHRIHTCGLFAGAGVPDTTIFSYMSMASRLPRQKKFK